MTPSSPAADRNLLFGLLALQMDFVSRDQLLEAMNAWMLAKGTPLGEVLVRRGVLAQDDRDDLDRLVLKHIKRHGGDPQASLAAVAVEPGLRRALDRLGDADVHASLAAWATPDNDSPQTVGPMPGFSLSQVRFRRLRPHARGGLGEVHIALDEELKREVALKEIQDKHADRPEARARFLREAEVTGKLEHPGVVPVYGLGTYPDGRPFYAMRFIRGESLQDAVARFHKADQDPRRSPGERSLALRELLSRFVDVCNAVAYAHSRGVIHRDLKPANVMLGEFGETLVVDWGVARLVHEADLEATDGHRSVRLAEERTALGTALGEVVGTPAYMPPEQALGQHDQEGPASDGFALGAMLYTLLTGQAPYTGSDVAEVLRQAQRAEVPPARQRNAAVPAALEAVCARALAVRPQERYPGAQALADEVRRWLADEPVQAYPEPLAERWRRWRRRHRSLVMAGSVLVVVVLVGLAVGLWLVRREQARTARALEAEEANLKLARKAVDECFNVAHEHPLFQLPRMEQARKLLLETTLAFYQDFEERRPDDPDLQAEKAEQRYRLARIQDVLGHTAQAQEYYEQARALWHELAQAHPEVPEHRSKLALTYNRMGNLLDEQGKRALARQAYQQARDLYLDLSRDHPERPEYQSGLAGMYNMLAKMLDREGKWQDSLKGYDQALTLFRKLVDAHPGHPEYKRYLAGAHHNRARLLSRRKSPKDAWKEYEQARALLLALVKAQAVPDYRTQEDLASTCNDLGTLLADGGQVELARIAYEQAYRLRKALARVHPEVPAYQEALARTRDYLGILLARQGDQLKHQGKLKEALPKYQQARALFREQLEARPQEPRSRCNLADLHGSLADLRDEQDRREEALEEYQHAHTLYGELAKAHPQVPDYTVKRARICLNRGELLSQLKRHPESLSELNEGLGLVNDLRRRQPRHPELASLGRELLLKRAVSRARAGDHVRAAAEADALDRAGIKDGLGLYNLACVYALNVAGVRRDPLRPLPERPRLALEYARRALALLRRAASARFFRDPGHVQELDRDPDLASLRDRADFRAFRAGLVPAP